MLSNTPEPGKIYFKYKGHGGEYILRKYLGVSQWGMGRVGIERDMFHHQMRVLKEEDEK